MIVSNYKFKSFDEMIDFKKVIEETLDKYKKRKENGTLYSSKIKMLEDETFELSFVVTNEIQNN